jgi:hypothetical protein
MLASLERDAKALRSLPHVLPNNGFSRHHLESISHTTPVHRPKK